MSVREIFETFLGRRGFLKHREPLFFMYIT